MNQTGLQITGRRLVLEAAGILNNILNLPDLYTEDKINQTPVTLADFLIQINIMLTLSELYPEDRFVGEERLDAHKLSQIETLLQHVNLYQEYAQQLSKFKRQILPQYHNFLFDIHDPRPASRVWINDPLDGTTNFMKKNGQYACSLGLMEWNAGTKSYWPVYAILYAPHYRTSYRQQEITAPLVEVWEGLESPILYQTRKTVDLEKLAILDLKATLLNNKPKGPISRDSKRFGANPLDRFLEKYYPKDTFVKQWGSSVLGILEVILGNHVLYSSTMSLWDFTAAAYILLKAGGSPIRTDNASKLESFDPEYLKTILDQGDRHHPIVATVGGKHAEITIKCLQSIKRNSDR